MTTIEAVVLGIVQGITEFLPISSTAHLRVVPALVGSRLIQWDLDGSGAVWTFQSIYVQASGPTADPTRRLVACLR